MPVVALMKLKAQGTPLGTPVTLKEPLDGLTVALKIPATPQSNAILVLVTDQADSDAETASPTLDTDVWLRDPLTDAPEEVVVPELEDPLLPHPAVQSASVASTEPTIRDLRS